MPEEKKKRNKRSPEVRKRRRKRVLLGSFWFSFLVFVVPAIFIFFYGSRILANFLIKTVEYQSDGMYKVEFDDVSINFLDKGFEISDFHLIPNDSIYREKKKQGLVQTGLYDIKVPYFKVSGFKITSAFYENTFIINSLLIDKPELALLDVPFFSNQNEYREGYDDIKPIIVELVEYFRVKNLKINDGIFDIFTDKGGKTETFTASKISLNLIDFQIDKKNKRGKEKFLYSEGAELVFNNYKLRLNDGLHIVEANEIGINTIDSVLYARGFSMSPTQLSKEDLRKSERSYFSAFIPEILVNGADIIKAYEEDTLTIKSLNVLRPKINYFNQKPLSKRTKSTKTLRNQIDIYPLVTGHLNKVTISEFNLEKGNFNYSEPLEGVPENIKIKGIDVNLENFEVDSLAYKRTDRVLYSSEMILDFLSFEMSLRDSVHMLEAKSLFISTKEDIIRAKDLEIRPTLKVKTSQKKDQLTIKLPELSLTGIDLYGMYLKGELNAELLNLISPTVKIDIRKQGEKRNESRKSAGDVYGLFSNYLKSAKLNKIEMDDGTVHFLQDVNDKKEEIFADNINLSLFNFKLDSILFVTGNQFLFSENVEFNLRDYDFILPNEINEIRVGSFNFSSKRKEINFEKVEMRVLDKKRVYDKLIERNESGYLEFDIPSIRITDADVMHALNNQILEFGKMQLINPEIRKYKYAELSNVPKLPPSMDVIQISIQKIFPEIEIDKISLEKGRVFNYLIKKDSIDMRLENEIYMEIEKFSVKSDSTVPVRLFFSENVKIRLIDQDMLFDDELHYIHTDSVILNYHSNTLDFYNFELIPKMLSLKTYKKQVYYKIHAPVARFEEMDILKFYDDQILNVKNGFFDTVYFEVHNNPFYEGIDTITPVKFRMPNIMSELKLENLNFRHGVIRYFDKEDKIIAKGHFEGKISKTLLSEGTIGENPTLTPAQDIQITFPDLELVLNPNYTLKVNDLKFDLEDDLISSKQIQISVDTNRINKVSPNGSYILFTSDSFQMAGMDIEDYYLKNRVNIDEISFWQPEIKTYSTEESGRKPAIDSLDFYPMVKSFAESLDISSLKLINGIFGQYILIDDSVQIKTSLERVYVDFTNISIHENSDSIKDKIMFSDDINFRLKDYSRVLNDELMSINFKEIGISSGRAELYAKGLHLKPLFNEEEYAEKLKYQDDRIDFKARDVSLLNVDLKLLYNENILDAAELMIDSFYVDDYRDKRIPLKEDFRPPILHEMLRNAPIVFMIDSIQLNNGNASYREFAIDGEQAGLVYFNDMKGKIYAVSNDSGYYLNSSNTYLYVIGKLMNQGDIIMSGNFNLLDTNNTFSIRGSLGMMDMTAVNPMLENVAFVSIKSGIARSLNFNFEADEDYSRGQLNFSYTKFKIFLVNRKTGEPEGVGEGIASWFANTFLLNAKNPHLGIFKEGEVYFRRDKSKSIVNYVWKSIFSGIKTSIGAQTQKKLHKIAEKEEKAKSK